MNCSVLNCTNASKSSDNQKKVNFFNFPKESKTLSKWILFTGRGHNWRPNDLQKLCSEHFQQSAFIENDELTSCKRILKSNAIPTVVTLDECDDDVEYVMEEDSDEEQPKVEENVDERSKESVVSTATDSQKRRRSKDHAENVATKKPRRNETRSEVEKGDGKQLFAHQFMEFVGVYNPSTQTKKCTQKNRESQNKSVTQENSTTYEKDALTNNTTKNDLKVQEHIISDDECNDEGDVNLVETVRAIKHKLNSVEKTLLNVLDQIDVIRQEVIKVATSTRKSKPTVKAVKKEPQASGGSTNRNQNNCTYLKGHQRSDVKKPISSTQSHSSTFNRFPIQSTDEFQKFNAELNTTSELEQFTISMFKRTNHSPVEIFVEENLKNLIDENVAKSMSWSGLNSEFAVKNTPVVALLRDAVVTRFNFQIKSPAVNLIRLYFGK